MRSASAWGPDEPSAVDQHNGADVYQSAYYISMRMLADALGIQLEEVHYHREVAVTDQAFEIAAGTIEAGTVAAMKFVFDGIVHGRPVISFQIVWRVSDEVAPEWPVGDSRWMLHVDGDPTIDSEITLATKEDAARAVSLSVATLLLNSVPSVVAAAPGLLDNLTMPQHGGGYFAA
jgi:hypothetical protein